PEDIVKILADRLKAENAGLYDLAAKAPLDDDPSARLAIDGHTGRKGWKVEKAEPLRQCRPLGVACDDLDCGALCAHSVKIDDA
ncbi:hypothetical protein, partial [Bacillus cereus group sp. Bce006]|uniref:hypothetical protein n=1 Tax=Bacillus cereus group sp. Bce006 TaxID=3445255 RepID=UPI003F21CD5E